MILSTHHRSLWEGGEERGSHSCADPRGRHACFWPLAQLSSITTWLWATVRTFSASAASLSRATLGAASEGFLRSYHSCSRTFFRDPSGTSVQTWTRVTVNSGRLGLSLIKSLSKFSCEPVLFQSLIYSLILSFIHSLVHLFDHSFIHSLIYTFTHSLI